MSLQQLLGDIPKQQFVAEYLHRRPFSLPRAAGAFCPLGTWQVLGELLAQESVDLLVVRDGQRVDVARPQNLHAAQELSAQGHTILVRHAERHHTGLRQLADSFRDDLQASVDVHMYFTPAGRHGFSWHYDAEDVFILQTAGVKEYLLRQNTVNPWPLVETTPHDMRFERESMPVMRATLHAGDWLYIPCGWWHRAEAKEDQEAAISLAVGVTSPAAIDVFDFLRTRLLDSILWRQRLPAGGAASPLTDQQLELRDREIISQLADDVDAQLRSESFARRFREWLQAKAGGSAPADDRTP